ncbi:MAG: macro domain-containing protein [Promethearchaeota archaeon]|jgi:O-acetyl-ADP-ribose deacetylase (regulator of RNase III)
MREIAVKNSKIMLVQGDITELSKDAIVNAANTQLILGGGVAGAIKKKGGPKIQEECNKIGGTFVGGAVITTGGNLKAKHVIHAVGPRMGEGNEDEKLRNATLNSLRLMDDNKLKTIAFPAISTGIFGYPIEKCSKVMIATVKEYLKTNTQINEVIFCLYTNSDFEVFDKELK